MLNRPIVMVGVSAAIRSIEEDIQYAARSDAKVLITGESGVGKEVVARLIHQRSSRGSGPLVTINCAGFPDSLLETEMFGHMKGSFTDAYRDKRGWLEMAHGGTIFMDEVGEMSLRMQALMLRFLETGEIQRVGSERQGPPPQRPRHHRHPSAPARAHRRQDVPRGSLLPPERHPHRGAAAARPPRRHQRAAGRTSSGRPRPHIARPSPS